MQFDIRIAEEKYSRKTGWFSYVEETSFRVYWKLTLTSEEERSVSQYNLGNLVIWEEPSGNTFASLRSSVDENSRKLLDAPINHGLKDFLGENRGISFDTPGEARQHEERLRYDLFPKIEALLFNNRPI